MQFELSELKIHWLTTQIFQCDKEEFGTANLPRMCLSYLRQFVAQKQPQFGHIHYLFLHEIFDYL